MKNIKEFYEEHGLDWQEYEEQSRLAHKRREMYYENHSCCPQCGSKNFSSTYIGYVVVVGRVEKEFKDENRVSCTCGWRGITHDLVKICENI
jgi:RNA polymerase subunit RPABC4/transcription elongation factor Spt4